MAVLDYHGPVVAFDLDDTLFRERDFCRSGFRYLCDPESYRIFTGDSYPSDEQLEILVGEMDRELKERRNPFSPFESFFKPLVESQGIEWDLGHHISAYRSHLPNSLKMDTEIKETLNSLKEKGIRMALITDGRSVTQRRKIEALGLYEFFSPEMILISEETGHDKLSSREMFASVVRNFPEAKEFFYVGNNPRKDFYNPNLMGWTTIQIPYHQDEVNPQAPPPSPIHAAKINVSRFNEILNYIQYHI